MSLLLNSPPLLFAVMVPLLWIASRVGARFRNRHPAPANLDEEDLSLILAATLSLLGLIIGFSFSMAVSRYDQRKNYEEQEANAIGTEYLRLDVLPEAEATRARALLRDYLDQRILYYTRRDPQLIRQITAKTAELQSGLWSTVRVPATAQPHAVSALVLAGMNNVLDSEGYTEAAWRNRIPLGGWILMILLAACCNLLFGLRAHSRSALLFLVLPVVLSLAIGLIAEIDSPRSGIIRVRAQNLQTLADSLRQQR